MKLRRLFQYIRSAAWTSAITLGIFISSNVCQAREIRATPTEETKRQASEAQRHELEVWKQIEPQIQEWARKGKPYIPQAEKPSDLPQAGVPAFPGAEGAGMYSFGGRGGKVYVVTSLEDSGPGSFREACEAAGPRIVVFNVAGIIRLKSPLHVRAPYLTIAGQTAPGDGVCIAENVTSIDTHDVVIRYMRFRRGMADEQHREHSLTGNVVGNMIVDHCSVSWSMEENLSMYRHMYSPPDGSKDLKLPSVNITIQYSISSEGLDPNKHAFGGTWGGRNTSFHHNLFANNTGRNPSIGMGYDFNFVNNVLFNWRHRSIDGGDETSLYNIINNYLKPGPASTEESARHRILKPQQSWSKAHPVSRWGRAYVAGNIVEGDEKVTADNWDGGVQFGTDPAEAMKTGESRLTDPARIAALTAKVRADKPFPMAPITMHSAKEAFDVVLSNAGATLPRRDSVDTRVLAEVRSGQVTYKEGQGIITDISQIGGFPNYTGTPVANLGPDGIPAWWKIKYHLDPNDTALASKDLQGDGYTVLDKFLNGLDPTVKIDWASPSSNLNTLTADKLLPPQVAAESSQETSYSQKIEERTRDILALLDIADSAAKKRVHDVVINQYRELSAWHAANDNRLKELTKASEGSDREMAVAAKEPLAQIQTSRKALHDQFIATLSTDLNPEQVEKIKDKMTYSKVKVTFNAYCEIIPVLNDAQKTRILEFLKEAREEAMDGGNEPEKSAVFKKYKGKIKSYLAEQGIDEMKFRQEWSKKQKEKAAAKWACLDKMDAKSGG